MRITMPNGNRKPFNPKAFRVVDYGDYTSVFADDLSVIQELGPVTHLVFAAVTQPASGDDITERRVVVRLIIPTELLQQIGRQLIAGTGASPTVMPLDELVH
jgi:hypothetical protein